MLPLKCYLFNEMLLPALFPGSQHGSQKQIWQVQKPNFFFFFSIGEENCPVTWSASSWTGVLQKSLQAWEKCNFLRTCLASSSLHSWVGKGLSLNSGKVFLF